MTLLDTIVNGLKKFEQEWEREFNMFNMLSFHTAMGTGTGQGQGT